MNPNVAIGQQAPMQPQRTPINVQIAQHFRNAQTKATLPWQQAITPEERTNPVLQLSTLFRSEERRVGKECPV